jgi:stage II sporulation protein D
MSNDRSNDPSNDPSIDFSTEPAISVGLLQAIPTVAIQTTGTFIADDGAELPEGEYHVTREGDDVVVEGPVSGRYPAWSVRPADAESGRFAFETVIGIDFHWEQKERQSFAGGLRIIPDGTDALTIINDVPLETYLGSVIASEMRATSAPDLSRAHAVISRSWLLAQIARRGIAPPSVPGGRPEAGTSWIRWYDREAHLDFDVCADDHCQRYQGVGRMDENPRVLEAIRETRGHVLTYEGHVCDARYSKCCGGVTEDFRAAWGDEYVPYLIPFRDDADPAMPQPPLTDEDGMRAFIENPPPAWCNCSDVELLGTFLNPYDLHTLDFYRWTTRLDADQASDLVRAKLGVDLGRVVALRPVERAASGRLVQLEIVGENGSITIGKELEIRRTLSPKHLYSSAFVVDVEGDPARPDAFILKGAGWGHGVGFCQIGGAVMAARGIGYQQILAHYYPGTELETLYR